MRHIITLLILFFCTALFAQNNVVKTAGVSYTAGAPTFSPGRTGSQVAIDTVTGFWYEHNGTSWSASGYRVQTISGCSAPAYTPAKYQSRLVINACTAGQGGPELYYYTGSVWLQINEGQTYTAGTGIDITAGVISNTAPGHTLKDGGTSMTARTGANFVSTSTVSAALTDDGAGDETEIRMSIPTDAITAVEIAADAVGPTELVSTAVTPGAYTYMSGTVDADGRLTAASSGTAPVTGSGTSGQVTHWNGAGTITGSSNFTYLGDQASLLYNNNNQSPILSLRNSNSGASASTRMWLYNDVTPASNRGASIFLTNAAWGSPYTSAMGIWNYENGPIIFTSNNSEKMRVTPSGLSIGTTSNASQLLHVSGNAYISGSLGIGTSSPTVKLDVVGNALFSNSQITVNSGSQDIATYSTTSGVGRAVVNSLSNSGFSMKIDGAEKWVMASYLPSGTNYSFTFYNTQLSSDAFYISGDNNNIGFGTNTPSQRLDVNGNTRLRAALYDGLNSAGTSGYVLTSTGSATQWKNSASVLSGSTYVPTGTADALGTTGDFSYDSNYIYVKTPAGWKRATLSTF